MIYPVYEYIDYAFGGVSKRNNVIKVNDLKIPKNGTDCYRTYFRFQKDYLNHFNKRNTVKGYSGKCYSDFIPVDIDDNDLNSAYDKTKYFIELLNIDFEFTVQHIFFSGSKGFHLYLPSVSFNNFTPSEELPRIFKDIVVDICGKEVEVDLKNYEYNRLFRINNTVNSKTGLYKIALDYDEFYEGIEYITEIAHDLKQVNHPALTDYVQNSQFIELYQKHKIPQKNNLLSKIEHGVPKGERDDTAIRIVGLLRKGGLDKNATSMILHGWNKGLDEPLEESEIDKCINSGYKYENENMEVDIRHIWAFSDDYKSFVNSAKQVNLGISFIDKKIRGLRPGQVLTIMGFTGNFKSGLLQWIMRHYYQYSSEPVLMFQMEMSGLDIFERAMQMTTEKSGKEIEDIYKSNGNFSELLRSLREDQEKFMVVDRPGLSFEDMKEYILLSEKILREKIGLVGIDFLQLVRSTGQTNIQKMDSVAKDLKNFAKEMNVPVIALSQVTGIEDEYERINLMDSRDSKTIVQMSDYAIGIRLSKDGDDIQILDLLKNRKGGKGTGKLKIDRKSMRFEEEE